MATWKRDFASGLIVLSPILVTIFVIYWLYVRLADLPIVRQVPDPFGALLAVAVFIMLVFSIGYLMRTTAGRLFEARLDTAMNRVPLIRVLYNASKLAVETAVSGTDDLQRPVRVETWDGLRMTAFQTGQRTDDGLEVLFLPTAPNITSGFVIEVEPDQYEPTGETVEQALTRVLSAGFAEEETVERIETLDANHGIGRSNDESTDDDAAEDGAPSPDPDVGSTAAAGGGTAEPSGPDSTADSSGAGASDRSETNSSGAARGADRS